MYLHHKDTRCFCLVYLLAIQHIQSQHCHLVLVLSDSPDTRGVPLACRGEHYTGTTRCELRGCLHKNVWSFYSLTLQRLDTISIPNLSHLTRVKREDWSLCFLFSLSSLSTHFLASWLASTRTTKCKTRGKKSFLPKAGEPLDKQTE
jgi:hypothetical protein